MAIRSRRLVSWYMEYQGSNASWLSSRTVTPFFSASLTLYLVLAFMAERTASKGPEMSTITVLGGWMSLGDFLTPGPVPRQKGSSPAFSHGRSNLRSSVPGGR